MTTCNCASLTRQRDRALAKLARMAAARGPEALARRVLQVGPNEWRVPSDTADGGSRTVTYSERFERYACDCRHNTFRGDCRHVAAVSLYNRAHVHMTVASAPQ